MPLALCWFALLMVPVRVVNRRPVTRRTIWVPVIASGFLAAVLALGAGFAVVECIAGNGSEWYDAAMFTAVGAWAIWTIVFALMARAREPEELGMRLHRWLLAGSALELLIAVPAHVIVRRRNDCCAGMATGFGICCGIGVMLVAFGPSVLILYHKRKREISNHR